MFTSIALVLLIPVAIYVAMSLLAVFLARQLSHERLSKRNIALVFVVVLGVQLLFFSFIVTHPFSGTFGLFIVSLFVSTAIGTLYGVYSFYPWAKWFAWLMLAAGIGSMALVSSSYIVQKIPDLIPDHSTNFQEYAPSQNLAGYKITGTKLYIEDHGSFLNKSVSFSFENSSLRFGEENGGSSYSSSCKGYVPAGSCRNVTTPKGTTYGVEPGLKDTGEIIRWSQGTTYLYIGIKSDLKNKVSDAEVSAFIDSLKPTHYDSIPIVRTKPVED